MSISSKFIVILLSFLMSVDLVIVICVFFISFFVSFLVLLRVMDFASLVRESVFDVIDYVCFLFC